MTANRDCNCEIMAVIVLTVLSALSHFWYIVIAVCAVTGLAVAGYLIASIFLHARRVVVARLLSPASHNDTRPETEVSVGGARPSLPVA